MRRTGAFVVIALILEACGGEAGGPSLSGEAFAQWEAGEPDVRIGSVAGEIVLGRVLGVAIGPDRSVYVLDGQEAAVRVFDEAGRPLRTVGRKGEGPGEFTTPRRIGVPDRSDEHAACRRGADLAQRSPARPHVEQRRVPCQTPTRGRLDPGLRTLQPYVMSTRNSGFRGWAD